MEIITLETKVYKFLESNFPNHKIDKDLCGFPTIVDNTQNWKHITIEYYDYSEYYEDYELGLSTANIYFQFDNFAEFSNMFHKLIDYPVSEPITAQPKKEFEDFITSLNLTITEKYQDHWMTDTGDFFKYDAKDILTKKCFHFSNKNVNRCLHFNSIENFKRFYEYVNF